MELLDSMAPKLDFEAVLAALLFLGSFLYVLEVNLEYTTVSPPHHYNYVSRQSCGHFVFLHDLLLNTRNANRTQTRIALDKAH